MGTDKEKYEIDKVCILGVGLIGGSIGMALKDRGFARSVVGCDIDEENLAFAEDIKAVDMGTTDTAAAVRDADIVILSTPVEAFSNLARDIFPYLKHNAIVTDTGSTKSSIVYELQDIFPDGIHFLGGHPMSGSEKGGLAGADKYLFENAVYVLTPTDETQDWVVERMSGLVEVLGARVFILSPEEHDMVVAAVSHVPHLAASGLVLTLMDVAEEYSYAPTLAAGGFRDSTRIAAGDPDLWQQICFSNREKVVEVLRILRSNLFQLEESLRDNRKSDFREALKRAKDQRIKIPAKLKGILPAIYELVVTVPDKPGIVGYLGQLLGDNGINIIDIEILRVREGEGGTIRLGFQNEEARNRAAMVFHENRITVRRL